MLNIVFMGNADFAIPSLKLLREYHNIKAVVTNPDKVQGRGRKIQGTPVKDYCIENNIPILQPEKLRNEEFIETLRSQNADIFVVIAFRMLPKVIWNMPPMKTINLHGSLLPDYKGAAPIHRAIMDGQIMTGVSTFIINENIDEGQILLQDEEPINFKDTFTSLSDRLKYKGADLILKTINALEKGSLTPLKIDNSKMIHYASKIEPDDCQIDWDKSSIEVYNFIRGLSDTPCAWTYIDNVRHKIFEAEISENTELNPGEIKVDKKHFFIGTRDKAISILSIQKESKRRMNISEYLAGYMNQLKKS